MALVRYCRARLLCSAHCCILRVIAAPFRSFRALPHTVCPQTIPSVYAYANGSAVLSFIDRAVPTAAGAWARNPIPDHTQGGSTSKLKTEFAPPCCDDTSPPTLGLCSGERPFRLSIVDQIIVPAETPPGDYVLGFRWDCEVRKFLSNQLSRVHFPRPCGIDRALLTTPPLTSQETAQIWSTCSDITIVS